MADIIFFQTNPAFCNEEELELVLGLIGLKRDEDYLLKCDSDHTWALDALAAGRRQLFFSSIGSSRLLPQERCALVKDLNPEALFITFASSLPNKEKREGLDGWFERSEHGTNWLYFQLAIKGFLQGLPDEEFMRWLRR